MREEKKIYAVIDTNVLVSALFSRDGLSNPSKVIKAVLNGIIIPVFNFEIIEEYREVLARKKFNFNPIHIDNLIGAFMEFGLSSFRAKVEEEFPDKDDAVFFEVTMSVKDAVLVTGNIKHFPNKPIVVTPTQMVELLLSEGLI